MNPEPVTFPAADGRLLGGTVHAPPAPVGAAIIFGALGVPHRAYRRLAAHLAARGLAVLSFDYRGVGASRDRPLRQDTATLQDWARLDAAAAVDHARTRWPTRSIAGIGHSFGGHSFGLNPRAGDLDRLVLLGAAAGDLTNWPATLAWRHRLVFSLVPTVAGLAGYVPRWVGLGAELPGGVAREWSAWCQTPGDAPAALGGTPTGFDRLEVPALFFDLPGDTVAPPGPAATLRGWFCNAHVEHHIVLPDALPAHAQGHFGVLRAGGEPVWDVVADFLDGASAVSAAG